MSFEISRAEQAPQSAGTYAPAVPARLAGGGQSHDLPLGLSHPNAVDGHLGEQVRYPDLAQALAAGDRRFDETVRAREGDALLIRADKALADLQTALEVIVKRYPPYGPDSPERVDLLNQVTGLRKQLESLAFLPEVGAFAARVHNLGEEAPVAESGPLIADQALAALLDKVVANRAELSQQREKIWAGLPSPVLTSEADAALAAVGRAGERLASLGVSLICGKMADLSE